MGFWKRLVVNEGDDLRDRFWDSKICAALGVIRSNLLERSLRLLRLLDLKFPSFPSPRGLSLSEALCFVGSNSDKVVGYLYNL